MHSLWMNISPDWADIPSGVGMLIPGARMEETDGRFRRPCKDTVTHLKKPRTGPITPLTDAHLDA